MMIQQNVNAQPMRKAPGRQKGVTMIEYALIAALVAIAAIVTLGTLGNSINTKFGDVSTAISA